MYIKFNYNRITKIFTRRMKCIKFYAESKCIVLYKRKIRYLEKNDIFLEILSKEKRCLFFDKEYRYYQFVCYLYICEISCIYIIMLLYIYIRNVMYTGTYEIGVLFSSWMKACGRTRRELPGWASVIRWQRGFVITARWHSSISSKRTRWRATIRKNICLFVKIDKKNNLSPHTRPRKNARWRQDPPSSAILWEIWKWIIFARQRSKLLEKSQYMMDARICNQPL